VAVIDDDATRSGERVFEVANRSYLSVTLQRGPLTVALLKSCRCKLLVVAASDLSSDKRTAAAAVAKQAGVELQLLADPLLEDPRGVPIASTGYGVAKRGYAIAKRTLDVILSFLLLVLLAPLLYLVAVLIWLDSPGPVFFSQKRVGRNGQFFEMYKFRSMYTTAPKYDYSPTQSCDTRITPIGKFLRRTSLDELPQLINVFLGDMSLVGPRPEMPFIVHRYSARQRERLQVIPGITGLWQLSADRAFPIHENIHHDLAYIQNRTLFMDLAILLHTPLKALRGGI
jgi:lipopolysaccharide/colanic/teichoic acid biosynthesis glycosyltransferase